jgi:hypothetical protein
MPASRHSDDRDLRLGTGQRGSEAKRGAELGCVPAGSGRVEPGVEGARQVAARVDDAVASGGDDRVPDLAATFVERVAGQALEP